MEGENPKKRPLDLDWTEILDRNDAEPPPLIVIKRTGTKEPEQQQLERSKPSPMSIFDDSPRDNCSSMNDRDLDEAIKRQKRHIEKLSLNLKDGGEKLRVRLNLLEEEQRQRRNLRQSDSDVDVCEKPAPLMRSDGFKRENASSEVPSQSAFSSSFSRKMEEDTDSSVGKAYNKEVSILGRCNRYKMKSNGSLSKRGRQKGQSSSRQFPFQCASRISYNKDNGASNVGSKSKASSTNLFCRNGESSPCNYSKKGDDCEVLPLKGSRPRKTQTVVLLDEDETQLADIMEEENKLAECMKDAKIYYPSSDDRECVEISYTDINSLAPESFLTSPIMNFYIRYLRIQTSPTNKAISDCHFFNTFFYKKLRQAISYKGSDKESFFIKFRRWWKGVNIFQKAYVLIPIHKDLHWSLVIICIPDKEEESGPIILHLDSLELHYSKTVFEDIKSYLKQEWNYMNQEVARSDIPIAERIWKHLPRRIEEKKIEVPQQKNDYDCGLFVLYFMERFIEEAPERLKKKDLAMFGKRWFRPEEASGLRVKIKKLLIDEFRKANDNGSVSESRPTTSELASPKADATPTR